MSIQTSAVDYYQYWHYFLELEKEFSNTLRYVEYVPKHLDVYSFEFTRLLLLTCSELDVIFKVISSDINESSSADSIGDYFSEIGSVYDITAEKVIVPRFSEILIPFHKWDKDNPPFWWTSHNKVKHQRHTYFYEATLKNTLYSISGLFIANLIVLDIHNLLSLTSEKPVFINREYSPQIRTTQRSYQIKKK